MEELKLTKKYFKLDEMKDPNHILNRYLNSE